MKIGSNATTLVTTAILGLPMLEAMRFPGMRDLMLRSGYEALEAGLSQGYKILPIFGLKREDVSGREHLVEKAAGYLDVRICSTGDPNHGVTRLDERQAQ
jgi:2-dehydropantoate 2-reductase